MVEKNSDSFSAKFRDEGNRSFQQGDFFFSLTLYNKVMKKKIIRWFFSVILNFYLFRQFALPNRMKSSLWAMQIEVPFL